MHRSGQSLAAKPCGHQKRASAPAPAGGLGDWRDLEDGRGLSMFATTDYAFPPADNAAYHSRATERIAHDACVTDYSPSIEAALARLSRAGGGTLLLGPGVFDHSRQVVVPSYVCVRGAGMDATVLRAGDYCAPYGKAGAVRVRDAERVSLLDFTQDGNRARQHLRNETERYGRYGIYTHLANFVWMARVRVRQNFLYAFDPHGSNDRWSYFLVIEDCVSEGNGLDGFTIDQYFYVSVLRCLARNNERHGVNVISGARFVLVKGCVADVNGAVSGKGFGLVAQNNLTDGDLNTNSVMFVENTVKDCFRGAVCLRDVWDVIVERNRFENCSCTRDYVVYELKKTRKVIISGNVIVGNPRREMKCVENAEFESR